jgi:hypothetical protein
VRAGDFEFGGKEMNTELSGPLTGAAEVVTMPKEDALDRFKEYSAALRISRSQHDRMMKSVYGALSEGLGVINPRAAIIKAGVEEINHLPKLAICRADQATVFFLRQHWQNEAFFSSFSGKYLLRSNQAAQKARHHTQIVKATVPIIPPEHRPETGRLEEYSILWEVEKWEALPRPQRPPGDPMLLKPLAQTGLYAVMAHWDVTDIEKMVLGAMYGN